MNRAITHSWARGLALVVVLGGRAAQAAGELDSIHITPSEVIATGASARQQLAVTGQLRDGTETDITAEVHWEIEPAEIATVDAKGRLVARQNGYAKVVARLGGLSSWIRIQVKGLDQVPPVSFHNDVMSILSKAGCNMGACHGSAKGKNGFKLSLRGEDPDLDFFSLSHDMRGRRVNRQSPDASLVLRKPTTQLPHEGGQRFAADSLSYRILRRWIAEGLANDPTDAARLERIETFPADRVLFEPACSQQLVVRAWFSDGTVRDVTHQAAYEANGSDVRISPEGKVTAEEHGETTILIRYLDQMATCRLAFLPDRGDFVRKDVPAWNYIDHHVLDKLRRLRIAASELSSDSEFIRRAYLDAIGVLPTAADVRQFLNDPAEKKRTRLIERLLDRSEFADFWALKWADLLRCEEKVLDAKGVHVFHCWLRNCVATDKPLDELVRELLTGRGSTYANPPANYYRAHRDPLVRGETAAQLFLGVRLKCARCHNHPFERWTQDDYYGWASLFARVQYKIIENRRRDRLDKHEFNGEQVVWMARSGEVTNLRTGRPAGPRFLETGTAPPIKGDRLEAVAQWVTAPENPFFARTLANRIWFHLIGGGMVEPVDDFRASNPPSNAALLDSLARDLVAHDYSLKHLVRTIMNSRTYQLSARPNASNAGDKTNFSHAQVRMLSAEQLLDAISSVTGVPERFPGYPTGVRAVQLAGVRTPSVFLRNFGKPERLLNCECERSSDTTLSQAFQLISGELINRKLAEPNNRIGQLMAVGRDDDQILTELYLSGVCRPPTGAELRGAGGLIAGASSRRVGLEDVLWGLLNSKEFLLRR